MTACRLYGVVPSGLALPETGRILESVADGEIAAVYESTDPDVRTATRDALVGHSTVLNAIAETGPVLPLRFGTVAASAEEVRTQILAPRHDEYVALLKALDGHAQFTLRVTFDEEQVLRDVVTADRELFALWEQTSAQPGALWQEEVRLGQRVAEGVEDRRQHLLAAVVEALSPHATRHHVSVGSGTDDAGDVAFLVADKDRQAFVAEAEAVAEGWHPLARFRLLGPLAPFQFVES